MSLFNRLFGHHNHPIDKIADVNAIICGIALYPQVFKIFVSSSTDGLSWLTYALILLNSAIWILYAVHRKLLPLLVSSALNFVASGLILAMVFYSRS